MKLLIYLTNNIEIIRQDIDYRTITIICTLWFLFVQVQIKIAIDNISKQSRRFWPDISESLVPFSKREKKDVIFKEKTKLLMDIAN